MRITNLLMATVLKLTPVKRVLAGLVMAAISLLICKQLMVKTAFIAIIMWNVFALTYLLTCWLVFIYRRVSEIRTIARVEDGSRTFVLLLLLASSIASLFTVLTLITSKKHNTLNDQLYLPITIVGMLLAWAVIHTTFTFHYANMFYNNHKNNPDQHAGGLSFPGNELPGYLDFAYFSFVVGMTFQVSDVQITSASIRRVALMHCLLSFGLNTFVVALTINVIAGLQGQ